MNSSKSPGINYLYFGLFFFCVAALQTFHILLTQQGSFSTRAIFIVDAVGQCFLGMVLLVFLSQVIRSFLPLFCFKLFIAFTFFLFLAQIYDFQLVRFFNATIWWGIKYVFIEISPKIFEMTQANGLPMKFWLLVVVCPFLLSALGIIVYFLSEKIIRKRALKGTSLQLFSSFVVFAALLAIWDYSFVRTVPLSAYDFYQKILPFKTTFFSPKIEKISLSPDLNFNEKKKSESFEKKLRSLEKKPDIYLFIVESLRSDFVTPEIAPNLAQFRKENLSFDHAYSNANCTHLSWFSLFNSSLPFYWKSNQTNASIPLQIIKQMGYTIRIFSSSGINYFQMGEKIFGKACHLAETYEYFGGAGTSFAERDSRNITRVLEEIKKNDVNQGHLYVIFLDSPHFFYDWPEKKQPVFVPVCEKSESWKATFSQKTLEGLKNRYRNAIHYVDELFGNFLQAINHLPQGNDSIIVVCGDHGEEFFEHNRFSHGSNLDEEQTRIPIFYKFGSNHNLPSTTLTRLTSQMDIFPTLCHYLLKNDSLAPFFEGESVFREKTRPYIISAGFNGSKTPRQFSIHNGRYKLLLEFSDEKEVFKSSSLYILSINDLRDEPISFTPDFVQKEFGPAIEHLFSP